MRDLLIAAGVAGGIGWIMQQLFHIARGLWWRFEDWLWEGYDDEPDPTDNDNDDWWLDILERREKRQ